LPSIIDYQIAYEMLLAQGLRCHYHNSGAFGFADAVETFVRGWIGPADGTIRSDMRSHVRKIDPPYETNLAQSLTNIWLQHFPGPAWVMPKSHWAHELNHGSREWMPALIEQVGLDPKVLQGRTTGDAIEFSAEESGSFHLFAQRLLEKLLGSDFLIAFPGHNVLCTLHHHKQLWWISTDADFIRKLDERTR
jgi:hypothetical protein